MQTGPRLAHLRRVRAAPGRTGEAALYGREPVGGPEQHRLRIGFNHHRSVPVIISVRVSRSTKAIVKMHTLQRFAWQYSGISSTFSDGKLHDVHALDILVQEAGAIYVMDRGYVDFARLHRLHEAGAFFVTRKKSNLSAHRVYSAATDHADRRHRRSTKSCWVEHYTKQKKLPGAILSGCVLGNPKTRGKPLYF